MYKIARIVFTCLSAICVASAFFVALKFGLIGFISCAVLALIFFVGMLFCKRLQELKEPTAQTEEPEENQEITKTEENKEE